MKKQLLFTGLLMLIAFFGFAQKYAYINSEYILSQIPEYKEAQAELDRVAVLWQKEIEAKFSTIDSMYKRYQVESITLPEQIKRSREEAIIAQERLPKICKRNVSVRTATFSRNARNW